MLYNYCLKKWGWGLKPPSPQAPTCLHPWIIMPCIFSIWLTLVQCHGVVAKLATLYVHCMGVTGMLSPKQYQSSAYYLKTYALLRIMLKLKCALFLLSLWEGMLKSLLRQAQKMEHPTKPQVSHENSPKICSYLILFLTKIMLSSLTWCA